MGTSRVQFRRFILQVNLLSIEWQTDRQTSWAWVNSAVVLSEAVLFDFGHWIQRVYSCARSKQSCPTLQTTRLLSYRKTFWIECNVFAASSFVSLYWLGTYVVAILCYLNTVNSIFIFSETFRRWTRQILCVNTVITLYKSYPFFFLLLRESVTREATWKTYSQDLVLFWFWGCNKWPHFLPLRSLFYYRSSGTNSFDSPREHHIPFFSPQNMAKIYRVNQSVSCTEKFICYVILRRCITYRIRITHVIRMWSLQTVICILTYF